VLKLPSFCSLLSLFLLKRSVFSFRLCTRSVGAGFAVCDRLRNLATPWYEFSSHYYCIVFLRIASRRFSILPCEKTSVRSAVDFNENIWPLRPIKNVYSRTHLSSQFYFCPQHRSPHFSTTTLDTKHPPAQAFHSLSTA